MWATCTTPLFGFNQGWACRTFSECSRHSSHAAFCATKCDTNGHRHMKRLTRTTRLLPIIGAFCVLGLAVASRQIEAAGQAQAATPAAPASATPPAADEGIPITHEKTKTV